MRNGLVSITFFLCASLLLSACATTELWENTNPRERVWVSSSEVTEELLIEQKIPYNIYQGDLGPGFLIPKTKAQRLGDYTIRALAAPVTVTVDAATVVAVVGLIVFLEHPDIFLHRHEKSSNHARHEPHKKSHAPER